MKQKILWLYVCCACVYHGMLETEDFRFFAVGFLLLLCILERRKFCGGPGRQEQSGRENYFWETFRKEFVSSLAKAATSLLMAVIGVLLLGETGSTATPAAIGISIGAIILSSLGGF